LSSACCLMFLSLAFCQLPTANCLVPAA
jgi:hypothetical protein